MTNEERDIITRFIERVSGSQPGGFSGSVPGTAPALPPVDREADALIGDMFTRYPDARYRLTQTAFVQEHALVEAQNRIKRLEWELEQAKQSGAGAGQSQSRGFFGNLFGGGQAQPSRPAPPPPQYQQPPQYQPPPPQYAPGYQAGMFQRPGSGFLGSALTTAAGVAGGMVVGNALMDMFSPHQGFGGGLGGGLGGGAAGGSPWSGSPGADAGAAGWDSQTEGPDGAGAGGWDNQGGADPASGWDQGGGTDPGVDNSGGGWDDAGGADTGGGGWDDNT